MSANEREVHANIQSSPKILSHHFGKVKFPSALSQKLKLQSFSGIDLEMSSNNTLLEDYYKTPKEVAEALKVKDLQTLIRGIVSAYQYLLTCHLKAFLL